MGSIVMIALAGAIIVVTMLIRSGFRRIGVPSLVGFIVLGLLIRIADMQLEFITEGLSSVFDFLATVGIVFLLFRVGLEANLAGLRRQIKPASVIWAGGVFLNGVLGYVVANSLLGLPLVQSLFVAVALTATSVAISVGVWQEAKALKSRIGQLLVDVAELDDISGIILMAVLFAIAPVLQEGIVPGLPSVLGKTAGLAIAKFIGFGALCLLFSRFVERHVTALFKKLEARPGQTVVLAGFGLLIASVAGLLGFSVAIGAFFAGLTFSRDPEAVRLDTPFSILYDFFAPFFFIGVGLSMDPSALGGAVLMGLALLVVAVTAKIVGHGLPALITTTWAGAVVIGVSMIPRAEITMVIMHTGLRMGEWAVPDDVFSAMVLVSLGTAILSPLLVQQLLRRWPQAKKAKA